MPFIEKLKANSINMDRLELSQIDIVSFDVYDTLIKRTVKKPEDVFELVQIRYNNGGFGTEKDFFKKRIVAERIARRKCLKEDITLDDIYRVIDLDEKNKNIFKSLEIETEIEVSVPNEQLVDYLSEIVGKKRIIIISDMYLPRTVIVRILRRNCIFEDMYESLFVSGELGLTKSKGSLFDYVVTELDIQPIRLLHIGDNPVSDVEIPKSRGINTYQVESGDCNNSRWDRIIKEDITINHLSSFINLTVNKEYGTPFCFGYTILGPILYSYMIWLHDQLVYRGINSAIFLSREGYLLKKIFDSLFCDIDSKYMSINGRTLLFPMLYIDGSIENFFDNIPISRPRYCVRRLVEYLSIDSNDNIDKIMTTYGYTNNDYRSKEQLIWDCTFNRMYSELIQKYSYLYKEQYVLLIKYLSQCDISGNVALINNSMSASTQRKLKKIIEFSNIKNIKLLNVHFIRNRELKDYDLDSVTWFGASCVQWMKRVFYKNCIVFERILFPDTGTALYYTVKNKKVIPVTEVKEEEQDNSGVNSEIRKGIFDFLDRYRVSIPLYIEPKYCLSIFTRFLLYPEKSEVSTIGKIVDYDEGTVQRLISDDEKWCDCIHNSRWKIGAMFARKRCIEHMYWFYRIVVGSFVKKWYE